MYKQSENGEPVTHVSQEEVRSGSSTKVNRNVLGVSLPLVIILLAILVAGGFWLTNRSGADEVNAGSMVTANEQAATPN